MNEKGKGFEIENLREASEALERAEMVLVEALARAPKDFFLSPEAEKILREAVAFISLARARVARIRVFAEAKA
jgi:hypothetical protein